MSLTVNIKVTDKATPVLAELHRELTDRTELHQYIGAAGEAGTRMHIRAAAKDRHYTSKRLGASPTGYLTKRAELVQGKGSKEGAEIQVTGAIFARVFGPVTIRPRNKKMLTIPWAAESYGKRAGEFSGLFVYRSKLKDQVFLCRREGTEIKFLFLLKRQVILPQDRGLLPSDDQYGKTAELAARGYLRKLLREVGA